MNAIIELNQLCYNFGDDLNPDENKLLLVEEDVNGQSQWTILSKGWEYNLWYEFGERAGLAEAEELILKKDGQTMTIKIEDYVKRAKETLENGLPIKDVFSKFIFTVDAWRCKEGVKNFIIKEFEEDYELEIIKEDEKKFYYRKEITTVEQLKKIPCLFERKEHSIKINVKIKEGE